MRPIDEIHRIGRLLTELKHAWGSDFTREPADIPPWSPGRCSVADRKRFKSIFGVTVLFIVLVATALVEAGQSRVHAHADQSPPVFGDGSGCAPYESKANGTVIISDDDARPHSQPAEEPWQNWLRWDGEYRSRQRWQDKTIDEMLSHGCDRICPEPSFTVEFTRPKHNLHPADTTPRRKPSLDQCSGPRPHPLRCPKHP